MALLGSLPCRSRSCFMSTALAARATSGSIAPPASAQRSEAMPKLCFRRFKMKIGNAQPVCSAAHDVLAGFQLDFPGNGKRGIQNVLAGERIVKNLALLFRQFRPYCGGERHIAII